MKSVMKTLYIVLIALVIVTGGLMIVRGTQRAGETRTLPAAVESVERERAL